ncbi:PAS domain-containing protein [Novosphingobium sp. Gsoil 351]|uniref:PAS domain-containing protein n=1 Tax=Novosphingobium sp. Gsoil 351 TaxID=2675225 RepID=UPI0018A881FB|nr:PAS domain-containing protein [Novosphingobium sp. Gsoil 351]
MEFKNDSWEFVGGFGEHTRDMLATVLDQSEDCVKILDPDGRVEFMNRNGRCSMEIDDFATVSGKPWHTLWPEDAANQVRDALAAALVGRSSRFEAFCPTAKGTPKWWDIQVSPVRGNAGDVLAILAVSRDVTERHRAMESLTTMAHEMRHRLRNAYAVSGAIALASGREYPGASDFAEALAQRLNGLSAVQGSLIDPGEREQLPALVARIAHSFDPDGTLIRCDGLPAIDLGEQAVRLLALVLGELATNSLKHGALRDARPLDISAGEHDGVLQLDWREPLAVSLAGATSPAEGSGFRLMQRMARAHRGSFRIEQRDGELAAHLEVPVAL